MEQQKLRDAIKTISIWEGVPESVVIDEMEASLALAYQRVIQEGNPEKIAMWKKISPDGMPSVYEFASFLADLISTNSF